MASKGRHDSTSLPDPKFQVCLVGDSLKENTNLIEAIKKFNLPVIYGTKDQDFTKEGADFTTIYVLDEFEGEQFNSLHKAGHRILGPTTVMQYAEKNEPLPNSIRPLYTTSMKNLFITFSGFRTKDEVYPLVNLVHHMGGGVRKDFIMSKTTHLVAASCSSYSDKYKYAASLGVPIMTSKWIYEVWARRHDPSCYANSDEFIKQYRMLPFAGCKIALVGYQNDELQHMIDICKKNDGEIVEASDPSCSHVVVEDGSSINSSDCNPSAYILKNEWFWACIQMEAKSDERIYVFENSTVTSSSVILPVRGNKRKRLESVAHQLAMENCQDDFFSMNPDMKKRSGVAKLSISGSFLDATLSPDKSLDISADHKDLDTTYIQSPPLDMRTLSPRQQVCLELFQTECNYVGILNTIVTVFKEPLEDPKQAGGPLLAPAEIKIIFGNLPPIFEIHQKIRTELAVIIHNWSENQSIGKVILDHAHEFMKAYPPFVNFFEKTKEVLASCDLAKPRFHAFLKRCQSKPECGRQSLQELLIRPVQRLPSVILLLSDILKRTPKSDPDHEALEKAIQALKDVMMHINEDKRKTEGQVAMFDVVNDIENCPPNLLSSHRNLISKTDMLEATDILTKKSGTITMFLFNDVLEICKKRSRATNNLKSPGVTSLSGTLKTQSKSYKHLEMIPLSHIKRVVDVTETEDFRNSFAIAAWSSKELKEILLAFFLLEDVCKSLFLKTLCRQIADSVCKVDTENLLTCLGPEQLSLQSNDSSGNVLTKALNKTRDKLGRALSMRRTPTKRGLSRAVSTIISPLRTFGTPSNNMQNLRLSSVTNLSEFEPTSNSLSVSPVGNKKLKYSSLGGSALEYV